MKTGDYASARSDLFGPDLQDFMKRAARGLTRITCFGEGLPLSKNASSSPPTRTSSACRWRG